MAKVSAIEKNKRRRKLVARDASKRAALKAIIKIRSFRSRSASVQP
jgi:small subunit ribosomal protein S14